jgi:hypothetical protein
VLFYNEPNFEESFADKLLMLFAGDPLSDQAKYKSVAQIARTPVTVTRNTSPFRNETKWKRCEWLKNINQKLSPFTLVYLLDKYEIKSN